MSQIPIIENDLDSFFELDEFGIEVTILNKNVIGILTDYYQDIDGGEVGAEGAEVLLIIKSSDVVGVAHNDTVQTQGENFAVVNIQETNSGITRLKLARLDDDPIPPGAVTYYDAIVTYNGEIVNNG